MKRTLFTTILLCVILTLPSFAQDEDGYWPRSYFLGIGLSAVASRGDLNENLIRTKTEKGEKEIVHNPNLSFLFWPDFFIGVDIRQFSLSLNFNYWNYTNNLIQIEESVKENTRIWRFGVEFVYNFFWQEFFQPGLGLGYSYTSMATNNNVFPTDITKPRTDSELMGSSISLITNIRYFLTEDIILQTSLKYLRTWFGNLYTENAGTNDMTHTQWQTFILMEVAVIYHF